MQLFGVFLVFFAVGCLGEEVPSPQDLTGGAGAAMEGAAGDASAAIVLPAPRGSEEDPGLGEPDGGTGDAGEVTLTLADILPGEWSLWRQQTHIQCVYGTESDPGPVQTFDDIVITDAFELFHGEYHWWDPGVIEENVWHPNTNPTRNVWTSATVTMDTPDHLIGTAENWTQCGLSARFELELTRR